MSASTPKTSVSARFAPSLKATAALGILATLAACATSPSGPSTGPAPPPPPSGTQVQGREGVTPPFMAGRRITRVGLLLPFSLRPQDASALYSAAELALFDHGDQNTLLIPRDAGSTEADASAAAAALVRDGADIIIGPVLREGVQGAAEAAHAQQIPVIGFSSDRTVAGDGVYLLSFQPEDEVARLISYAASRNLRSVALLAPANDYGRRIEQSLRAEAARNGVTVGDVELYARNDAEAAAAAGRVATAGGVQAILIAENGTPLRAIGAALVRGGVDPTHVRLMGTSVWGGGEAQREPTLAGGWYVSTDPGARGDFESRYQAIYNNTPSRLASLAYDAVSLTALLSRDHGGQGFTRAGIENREGFLGSDGIFRFRSNGSIERGLAIMEVRATGVVAVDAAPRRFTGPSS